MGGLSGEVWGGVRGGGDFTDGKKGEEGFSLGLAGVLVGGVWVRVLPRLIFGRSVWMDWGVDWGIFWESEGFFLMMRKQKPRCGERIGAFELTETRRVEWVRGKGFRRPRIGDAGGRGCRVNPWPRERLRWVRGQRRWSR